MRERREGRVKQEARKPGEFIPGFLASSFKLFGSLHSVFSVTFCKITSSVRSPGFNRSCVHPVLSPTRVASLVLLILLLLLAPDPARRPSPRPIPRRPSHPWLRLLLRSALPALLSPAKKSHFVAFVAFVGFCKTFWSDNRFGSVKLWLFPPDNSSEQSVVEIQIRVPWRPFAVIFPRCVIG